jgi:hypothetical protein
LGALKNGCEGCATMPMTSSPTLLGSSFWYPTLSGLIDGPTAAALTAYKSDCVHRLGYDLGAHGEWIAGLPAEHPAER